MRLKIHHRTRYHYSEAVAENYNEVRLQPVSNSTQECHSFQLATVPEARIERYHDLHFNLVDHFYLSDPHADLDIIAQSEVTTQARAMDPATMRFPIARLDECVSMERCYDFLQRSEYVSLGVEVWRFAKDAIASEEDAIQATIAIMQRIHREFTYDGEATNVNTHMLEALSRRRGVCQDFAHVMLGACRSIGIPARYVSGYLYVGAEKMLRGDLASHAWVEVFLPGIDWLGFDPTNNCPVDQHHVKIAIGRDYADAAPVRGNFKGRALQEMAVEVSLERIDAPVPAG